MKILVGCETSGQIRDRLLSKGHMVYSCDLLPSDNPTQNHIIGDIREAIDWQDWDLGIFHPSCTRLCNSGVRWLHTPPPGKTKKEIWQELQDGAKLFSDIWNCGIPKIAIENPVMHKHAKKLIENFEPQNQTVQPWQFATHENASDNVKKRTCLWLRNLPNLKPLNILDGKTARAEIHLAPPGKDRWKIRSKTFDGIAQAIADQWC